MYLDEVLFKLGSTATLVRLVNGLVVVGSLLPGVLVFLLAILWLRGRASGADRPRRPMTRRAALTVGLGAVLGSVLVFLSSNRRARPSERAPAARAAPHRPNVILIVMDTTRADHVSCYGYARRTTPHVDRLAQDGVRFANALATASWTLPSVASMLTGLFPLSHGADHGHWRLDGGHATLAEVLGASGYETGGFVAGPFCKALFGLAQGFGTYDDALDPASANLALIRGAVRRIAPPLFDPQRRAEEINRRVFDWLARVRERPFFLFINYFGSSPFRVGDFGMISQLREHAGKNLEA